MTFLPSAYTGSLLWQNPAPLGVPCRRENFQGYFQVGFASFLLVAGFKEDTGKRGLSVRRCTAAYLPRLSRDEQDNSASSAQPSSAQSVCLWLLIPMGESCGEQGRVLSHVHCLLAKKGTLGTLGKCISKQWWFPCCDAVLDVVDFINSFISLV